MPAYTPSNGIKLFDADSAAEGWRGARFPTATCTELSDMTGNFAKTAEDAPNLCKIKATALVQSQRWLVEIRMPPAVLGSEVGI